MLERDSVSATAQLVSTRQGATRLSIAECVHASQHTSIPTSSAPLEAARSYVRLASARMSKCAVCFHPAADI